MKESIKELMLPFFNKHGFYLSSKSSIDGEGCCYRLSAEIGEGYYWYYAQEGRFALAIMNLCLKEDTVIEYEEHDFLSVTYYDTVSAEQLTPYKRLNANCIRGHISNRSPYRVKYHKNIPVRGMELMLVPEYFNEYLAHRFPDNLPDIKEPILMLNHISYFPELLLLMRQIQMFQGSHLSARLFYESKVAEIVSLILEKSESAPAQLHSLDKKLSIEDAQNLDTIKSYLSDHFAFHPTVEELARIACMSQSKLRYCFKKMYGCTITEFIRNKRMAHAEYMLLKTDLPVSQIALAVGYHHAGRFSALFQQSTGMLPLEYRQLLS